MMETCRLRRKNLGVVEVFFKGLLHYSILYRDVRQTERKEVGRNYSGIKCGNKTKYGKLGKDIM